MYNTLADVPELWGVDFINSTCMVTFEIVSQAMTIVNMQEIEEVEAYLW